MVSTGVRGDSIKLNLVIFHVSEGNEFGPLRIKRRLTKALGIFLSNHCTPKYSLGRVFLRLSDPILRPMLLVCGNSFPSSRSYSCKGEI